MNTTQWTQSKEMQEALSQIITQLSSLAKDSPELTEYFRKHSQVLKNFLPIAGCHYELLAGHNIFQTIYTEDLKSISEDSDQLLAFKKELEVAALKKEPKYLPSGTRLDSSLHGLTVQDAPSPRHVPGYNLTQFDHFFIPILVGEDVFGVLQIWMSPQSELEASLYLQVFFQACSAVQIYLKARKSFEISSELANLHGYARFLESCGGLLELSILSKKITSYIHLISGSDRVTLYIASDYRKILDTRYELYNHAYSYTPLHSEGFQVPNYKSSEGQVITQASLTLLSSLITQLKKEDLANISKSSAPQATAIVPVSGQRKSLTYQWIERTKLEDPLYSFYLDQAPMNWATLLPLFDSQFQVCAYLFIEGKSSKDQASSLLLKNIDLPYSLGKILETSLFWHDRKSLKFIEKYESFKDRYLNTSQKEKIFWSAIPTLIFLLILFFPIPFYIKADAQIRPVNIEQIPAQTSARILQVNVTEGDFVSQGQVLMQLDTHDLDLAYAQYESEYLQSITEADRAFNDRDELAMQIAKISAAKSQAHLNNIAYQLNSATLRAPFDSVIIGPKGLNEKRGILTQVGQNLIELAKTDSWEVSAKLTESQLEYLADYLVEHNTIPAKLKLKSDPSIVYNLSLDNLSQLNHGLNADVIKGDYYFNAVLPLNVSPDQLASLKAGYAGRIAFDAGYKPLIYVLLRDAFLYIRVYWL